MNAIPRHQKHSHSAKVLAVILVCCSMSPAKVHRNGSVPSCSVGIEQWVGGWTTVLPAQRTRRQPWFPRVWCEYCQGGI